jgi:hypothetical protein
MPPKDHEDMDGDEDPENIDADDIESDSSYDENFTSSISTAREYLTSLLLQR